MTSQNVVEKEASRTVDGSFIKENSVATSNAVLKKFSQTYKQDNQSDDTELAVETRTSTGISTFLREKVGVRMILLGDEFQRNGSNGERFRSRAQHGSIGAADNDSERAEKISDKTKKVLEVVDVQIVLT